MHIILAYEIAKEEARKFYANIRILLSPALGKDIHFSAAGFNHIIFKRARIERNKSPQMERFELLPLAVKLLKTATTYQEFEKRHDGLYWGIVGIMENRKIKVVLWQPRKSGQVYFWSIIPNPITSRRRDLRFFEINSKNTA